MSHDRLESTSGQIPQRKAAAQCSQLIIFLIHMIELEGWLPNWNFKLKCLSSQLS